MGSSPVSRPAPQEMNGRFPADSIPPSVSNRWPMCAGWSLDTGI